MRCSGWYICMYTYAYIFNIRCWWRGKGVASGEYLPASWSPRRWVYCVVCYIYLAAWIVVVRGNWEAANCTEWTKDRRKLHLSLSLFLFTLLPPNCFASSQAPWFEYWNTRFFFAVLRMMVLLVRVLVIVLVVVSIPYFALYWSKVTTSAWEIHCDNLVKYKFVWCISCRYIKSSTQRD